MQDAIASFPSLTLSDLCELSAADTLLLTVNNRHARRVTLALAARLRTLRQASELPRILPLSAWLAESADELAFEPGHAVPAYRLSTFGAQLVWSDAIRQEELDRVLLDTAQAASLAMDADTLMDEWNISVPEGFETDEYRGFSRWRAHYGQALKRLDAEDFGHAYARVLNALEAGKLQCPKHLVLLGFSEYSPRLQRLLSAFSRHGTRICVLHEEQGEKAEAQRYQASDHGEEWRCAAAWAAERLAGNAKGRYAIISVQLESEAPFARRILSQALGGRDGSPAHPFNVAVGRPLTQWPATRAALAWLRALAHAASGDACDAEIYGAALRAGHCAGDSRDAANYAAIDVRWRRRGQITVDAAQWMRALESCEGLTLGWRRAASLWPQADSLASADTWMPIMKEALTALGFPGEKPLDSIAYQVMGALGKLLGDFAALAPAAGKLSGIAAVRLLESLAQASVFQPQRDPLARLDVLGLLEAEGGQWDGIWILGLSDEVLPASAKPNPLLPLAILRQAGAPRATPERELQWATTMYEAMRCCAPELIVSHAHMDGERELRPSPLIASATPFLWRACAASHDTELAQETLDDAQGPGLSSAEAGGGGLDVLDTQARNPLWAFVRHRLGARAMTPYASVATVNVRGQFLHKALELAWRMLKDQDALHELMQTRGLQALLKQCVDEAARVELSAYSPALRELECARACAVLISWFDLEAQRAPFTVEHVEKTLTWTRGLLSLKVRLDRMDRLADGRAVIVDYKTGSAASRPESDWSRARPVNVQLPFYTAVLAQEDSPAHSVAALVLAQVHAKHVGAQGLADNELGLEGVKLASESQFFEGLSWNDIVRNWRDAIEGLADEFMNGVANNRAYRRDDLKFCDALPFLRLHLDEEDA